MPNLTAIPGPAVHVGTALLAAFLAVAPAAQAAHRPTARTFQAAWDSVRAHLELDDRLAADSIATRLLARARTETGDVSLAVTDALDLLVEAKIRGFKTREPQTAKLAEEALAIRERLQGLDHPAAHASLIGLGRVRISQNRYPEARDLLERALRISERAFGPNSVEYARALRTFGVLLNATGEYGLARDRLDRSLRIFEAHRPPPRRDMVLTLGAVSELARRTGDHAAVRSCEQRRIEIESEILGPDHPRVAIHMVSLAGQLSRERDWAGARPLLEQAISIVERHRGADSALLLEPLTLLAEVEQSAGAPDKAERLLERALRIGEARHGADHPWVAYTLRSLATVQMLAGRDERAEAALERALRIFEQRFGADDLHVAVILHSLSKTAGRRGDHSRARTLLDRALRIREQVQGPDHPDAARLLVDRAEMELPPDPAAAFEIALRAEAIGRQHLRLAAQSLSEREALSFARARYSALDLLIDLALRPTDRTFAPRAWEALQRSRAVVADELAGRMAVAADPALERVRHELERSSAALARLLVEGPGMAPATYRARLDSARVRREAAERALAAASAGYRRARARQDRSLDQIGAALPPRSALVAYARYSRDTTAALAAFVMRDRRVVAIPLGAAAPIDSLVEAWRREIATTDPDAPEAERRSRSVGEALRLRIWDPIAARLGRVERVFLVPEGSLNLVPPAALPVGASGYLVESGPTIHLLGAERDLLEDGIEQKLDGILALGGCSFDSAAASPAALIAASDPALATSADGRRSRQVPCPAFDDIAFEPLPGSATEVAAVASLWRSSGIRPKAGGEPSDPVVELTGPRASEEAFKRLAGGRRVLHVATHGFFLGQPCDSVTGRRGVMGLAPEVASAEHLAPRPPLAGLVLSGANQRARARGDQEDGILTAEEIAALDLSGLEWAVLSGCDTGVGEPIAGEGLSGLRRAFQIAGARTVIVSLWPVEDEAARGWMTSLYRSRLVRRFDTAQAARQASLDVLRDLRARRASTHPSRWAGFVAQGDWR